MRRAMTGAQLTDLLRRHRGLIVLLYLDGNDHATIGEVLGISTSNVGTKLGRIKHRLRVESQQLAKETSDGTR
jgi:DNA-directed RNA polymerase specialized sigma24 family protein